MAVMWGRLQLLAVASRCWVRSVCAYSDELYI